MKKFAIAIVSASFLVCGGSAFAQAPTSTTGQVATPPNGTAMMNSTSNPGTGVANPANAGGGTVITSPQGNQVKLDTSTTGQAGGGGGTQSTK